METATTTRDLRVSKIRVAVLAAALAVAGCASFEDDDPDRQERQHAVRKSATLDAWDHGRWERRGPGQCPRIPDGLDPEKDPAEERMRFGLSP